MQCQLSVQSFKSLKLVLIEDTLLPFFAEGNMIGLKIDSGRRSNYFNNGMFRMAGDTWSRNRYIFLRMVRQKYLIVAELVLFN